MNTSFENLLLDWPLSVIRDVDLATVIRDSPSKRYAIVNRALKKGILIRLRRGVYLIGKMFRKNQPSQFQTAHFLYGPSYISFESALFYHQWIPEAVYSITCATAKRTNEFDTPLGLFHYAHVPIRLCYMGVQRIEADQEAFFIAEPWKALADHYFVYNRNWNKAEDLCLDMRIEMEYMLNGDLNLLRTLSESYQNKRVRTFLTNILGSLKSGN